jgi:hypothetical protein
MDGTNGIAGESLQFCTAQTGWKNRVKLDAKSG